MEARPDVSECRYGKEKCDVHIGECSFVGDFKEYSIYAKGKKGVTADLKLISHAKPYRPGTAYFDFGDGEYYTWLCAVPQGEVSGTLSFGGQTITVHGTGYHDRQWENRFYLPEWNNWLWARQSFGDYSVLNFDFITSKETGYKRILKFDTGSEMLERDGSLIYEFMYSGENCKELMER